MNINIGNVEGLKWSEGKDGILISEPAIRTSGYRMIVVWLPPRTEYDLHGNDSIVVALRGHLIEPELKTLKSFTLKNVVLKSGDDGVLLWICEDTGDNKIMKDKILGLPLHWEHIRNMIPTKEFEQKDMYYTRPQIHLDGFRINLWYAGPNVHCGIHDHSDEKVPFLEIHTQLRGFGWMETFRERNYETIEKKVPMKIGFTHEPFWKIEKGKLIQYPLHQYEAGPDGALWMVFEDTKIL
jgi:hypothetical protein